MRLLLVGDFSSIHIYNYIKNIISNIECECIGYHIVSDDIPALYQDYYTKTNVKVVEGVDTEIYKNRGAFRFTVDTVKKLKTLGQFDYMHMHAVRQFICPALYLARKNFKKIILTYWGSDLYRSSVKQLAVTLPILHSADSIVLLTDDMRDYFANLPGFISRYVRKVQVFDFGNMFYEIIDKLSDNRKKCLNDLGFDENKLICTIGYIGRPQMQQLRTVKALLPFLKVKKDLLQIALPAYGISENDLAEITNLLQSNGISYKAFPYFMDSEEVSKLRVVSDIFIHAQTTDALSCAMLEHFYAGSVVINAEWLMYGTLKHNGIFYKTFKSFDELSHVLSMTLDNISEEKVSSRMNREAIAKISSWSNLSQYWKNLYK